MRTSRSVRSGSVNTQERKRSLISFCFSRAAIVASWLLLKRGTTLFLQIPPDQLEAQKGLLRCWVSTLVRMIGAAGNERAAEVLLLLDEAGALGGLSAV